MNQLSLKNLFRIALILSAIAPVSSAQAATATGNPSANVLNPISITAIDDLVFGELTVSNTNGGTVDINNTGSSRTSTGGVALLPGIFSAATFTLAGALNETFSLTLPGPATLTSGANTMSVDTFTSSQTGVGFSLGALGTEALIIGATLIVAANQPVGVYTGTFDVTVEYN